MLVMMAMQQRNNTAGASQQRPAVNASGAGESPGMKSPPAQSLLQQQNIQHMQMQLQQLQAQQGLLQGNPPNQNGQFPAAGSNQVQASMAGAGQTGVNIPQSQMMMMMQPQQMQQFAAMMARGGNMQQNPSFFPGNNNNPSGKPQGK